MTVEQPLAGAGSGVVQMNGWVAVLQRHGLLGPKFTVDPAAVWTVDLPLAGALAHEGVANRTLLVGPAGGFYSACGEDVYPGCWSALFAADVLRKALRHEHLQDALADYRQVWRTTLGDYLRGPQQNLRLLLPLVYRKPRHDRPAGRGDPAEQKRGAVGRVDRRVIGGKIPGVLLAGR